MTRRFEDYCRRKETAARAAKIPGSTTIEESPAGLVRLGTDWSRRLFDGDFLRASAPFIAGTPITSLVFVQSRDGNTAASDPSALGGGEGSMTG